MVSLVLRVIRHWLPLAVGISAVCFTLYVVIQQDIRIGGNDPQIQMAEDTASSLSSRNAQTLTEKIDISQSLSPFTIVYDAAGSVVSSNATLDGNTPAIPFGVLQAAKDHGENRITWQPRNGVRVASIIVPYAKGFVLVGRNMREIEMREDKEFAYVFIGWIISLAATLFSVILMQTLLKKKK